MLLIWPNKMADYRRHQLLLVGSWCSMHKQSVVWQHRWSAQNWHSWIAIAASHKVGGGLAIHLHLGTVSEVGYWQHWCACHWAIFLRGFVSCLIPSDIALLVVVHLLLGHSFLSYINGIFFSLSCLRKAGVFSWWNAGINSGKEYKMN